MLFAVAIVYGIYFITEKKYFNEEKEIKKITNVIDSNIGWFKDKDFDLMYSTVAHDSNFISINPSDKVIRGFEAFNKNSEIFKYPEFKYVSHNLKDLKITISRKRDVAWYYCVLNDYSTWEGQPANWENVRWTGVLEKRDGNWVIVQQHLSFAE